MSALQNANLSVDATSHVRKMLRRDGLTYSALLGYSKADLLGTHAAIGKTTWEWISQKVPGEYVSRAGGPHAWQRASIRLSHKKDEESLSWRSNTGRTWTLHFQPKNPNVFRVACPDSSAFRECQMVVRGKFCVRLLGSQNQCFDRIMNEDDIADFYGQPKHALSRKFKCPKPEVMHPPVANAFGAAAAAASSANTDPELMLTPTTRTMGPMMQQVGEHQDLYGDPLLSSASSASGRSDLTIRDSNSTFSSASSSASSSSATPSSSSASAASKKSKEKKHVRLRPSTFAAWCGKLSLAAMLTGRDSPEQRLYFRILTQQERVFRALQALQAAGGATLREWLTEIRDFSRRIRGHQLGEFRHGRGQQQGTNQTQTPVPEVFLPCLVAHLFGLRAIRDTDSLSRFAKLLGEKQAKLVPVDGTGTGSAGATINLNPGAAGVSSSSSSNTAPAGVAVAKTEASSPASADVGGNKDDATQIQIPSANRREQAPPDGGTTEVCPYTGNPIARKKSTGEAFRIVGAGDTSTSSAAASASTTSGQPATASSSSTPAKAGSLKSSSGTTTAPSAKKTPAAKKRSSSSSGSSGAATTGVGGVVVGTGAATSSTGPVVPEISASKCSPTSAEDNSDEVDAWTTRFLTRMNHFGKINADFNTSGSGPLVEVPLGGPTPLDDTKNPPSTSNKPPDPWHLELQNAYQNWFLKTLIDETWAPKPVAASSGATTNTSAKGKGKAKAKSAARAKTGARGAKKIAEPSSGDAANIAFDDGNGGDKDNDGATTSAAGAAAAASTKQRGRAARGSSSSSQPGGAKSGTSNSASSTRATAGGSSAKTDPTSSTPAAPLGSFRLSQELASGKDFAQRVNAFGNLHVQSLHPEESDGCQALLEHILFNLLRPRIAPDLWERCFLLTKKKNAIDKRTTGGGKMNTAAATTSRGSSASSSSATSSSQHESAAGAPAELAADNAASSANTTRPDRPPDPPAAPPVYDHRNDIWNQKVLKVFEKPSYSVTLVARAHPVATVSPGAATLAVICRNLLLLLEHTRNERRRYYDEARRLRLFELEAHKPMHTWLSQSVLFSPTRRSDVEVLAENKNTTTAADEKFREKKTPGKKAETETAADGSAAGGKNVSAPATDEEGMTLGDNGNAKSSSGAFSSMKDELDDHP
ncbi:unnamed protein product [Amoebophrya sp. A120]|nr:unnamed protein product [Amoebophrya sp. A120]|eukprot:GSA120T00000978001.1